MPLALSLGVITSAFVAAYATSNARAAWLGFLAMIPLFAVVRVCGPLRASAYGMLWGASFAVQLGFVGVAVTIPTILALIGLSATFAGLSAWLTRWIGFTPFVLGVGWMLTQAAMATLAPRIPLLHPQLGDSTWLEWIGSSLGYGAVAFLVGYVNALLIVGWAQLRATTGQRTCPKSSAFPANFALQCGSRWGSVTCLYTHAPRGPPTAVDRTYHFAA